MRWQGAEHTAVTISSALLISNRSSVVELELIHQHRRAFGRVAVLVVLELGDGELEILDFCVEVVDLERSRDLY